MSLTLLTWSHNLHHVNGTYTSIVRFPLVTKWWLVWEALWLTIIRPFPIINLSDVNSDKLEPIAHSCIRQTWPYLIHLFKKMWLKKGYGCPPGYFTLYWTHNSNYFECSPQDGPSIQKCFTQQKTSVIPDCMINLIYSSLRCFISSLYSKS